jgi:hypothetical protein
MIAPSSPRLGHEMRQFLKTPFKPRVQSSVPAYGLETNLSFYVALECRED